MPCCNRPAARGAHHDDPHAISNALCAPAPFRACHNHHGYLQQSTGLEVMGISTCVPLARYCVTRSFLSALTPTPQAVQEGGLWQPVSPVGALGAAGSDAECGVGVVPWWSDCKGNEPGSNRQQAALLV